MKKVLIISIIAALTLCSGCGKDNSSSAVSSETSSISTTKEKKKAKSTKKTDVKTTEKTIEENITLTNIETTTKSIVESTEVESTPEFEQIETSTANNNDIDILDLLSIDYAYNPQGAFCLTILNESDSLLQIRLQMTARDANNTIIGTESVMLNDIFPHRYFYDAFNSPFREKAASVEFKIVDAWERYIPEWYSDNFIEPTAENISIRDNEIGDKNANITGEIKNDNDYDLPEQKVYLIIYDQNGDIEPQTFAYLTYTEEIKAHSSEPFQIKTFFDLSQKDYQVYVQLSS